MATGSTDDTVRIRIPVEGSCVAALTLHLAVSGLATVPNQHLAVVTDAGVAVLDIGEVTRR